jgi:probable O-glycosylation ligase (exosortase A-associated)
MRDYVLTALIFALVPVSLARPWIGVLVFAWLGFMNPHKQTWGFARDMPFALIIGVATLLGLFATRDRKPIPWTAELSLLAVMFAHFTLTSYTGWASADAWEQWEKVGKIFLMIFVLTALIYGEKRIKALVWVIALSIGYYGLKGAVFTLRTGGVFNVVGPENTFISGNTSVAVGFIMTLPLLVFLMRIETRPWIKRGFAVLVAATIISAVFTYSRGALLGLAGVLPLLFLRSKRKLLLLVLLVPLVYFGDALLPERLVNRAQTIETYQEDSSAMLRLQSWSVAKNIALERPLVGAGFNFEYGIPDAQWLSYADFMVKDAQNYGRAAHSIYFQMLGQHGFVGLALFLLLILFTFKQLRSVRAQAARATDLEWITLLAGALQISLVGYLIAGAFLSMAYFDLFYTYVGIAAMLRRELNTAAAKATEASTSTPAPVASDPASFGQGSYRQEVRLKSGG